MVRRARSDALLLISLFPNHSGNAQGVRHKQALHFPPSAMRVRWLKPSRNSRLNISERAVRKASFRLLARRSAGIEEGAADGIVAAIRQPRAQWIGPKPSRLSAAMRCAS